MPFKIYTYEDPYRIDAADFWNEIAMLPHFCGARTLVNGLKDVYGDKIKGLICPIDDLVRHEEVYKSWTDNISLRVQQYSVLSTAFSQLLERRQMSEAFHMALTQNQTHFLEAIRLFVELNISAYAIDGSKGNTEQRLFVYMLKRAQNSPLFEFPKTPSKEKIKQVLVALAKKEVSDCKSGARELKRCERAVKITEQQSLNCIVVHGLHQFSPAQLRLLLDMEKMGITIIFLFNYQKKYSRIYSSWTDVYGCFDVPMHHDSVVKEYSIPTMQNPSNALACALGDICEDNGTVRSASLRKWHQLYRNVQFLEFANITEYAHFVANHFEKAIETYKNSLSIMERGNKVWSNAGVLKCLGEQVYTANRDVHTLLKIYFPEYANDRHFLSYPIGQFFAAMYRLWDYENSQMFFDSNAIKECLSSNVLSAAPGEVLLRTFYNLEILFENVTTYKEFREKIVSEYVQNYDRVEKTKGSGTTSVAELKSLSVYSRYKVQRKDILNLIKAIDEINEIATYLFALDNSREDYINFGKHFRNLEEFLKQRELTLANEQERALINALQVRLDTIKPEKSAFSGTFRDLKEGLYYYLKQKNDEEPGVDWIVKNFEQIDGDILQSKRQFEQEQHKVYHFACVSDRDMNKTVNDQLPWPLTDEFIQAAYSPIDLQFQVYYTALGERSNFLRYALFYGLYYNRCDVRLSFVKECGEKIAEPYTLLSILGVTPKTQLIESLNKPAVYSVDIRPDVTRGVKYDKHQMMDMFLCPYRFFLDYVMENAPVIQGNFLYQKYFENLLIEAVWKQLENKPIAIAQSHLQATIDKETQRLRPYFGFWKETEIYDLKTRAHNYLLYEVITGKDGGLVKPFASEHMQVRKLFGSAKFVVDISELERKNPYTSFEALAKRNGWTKEYSLHKLPDASNLPLSDELRNDVKDYVNQVVSKDKTAIPSDWCLYCVHKGVCIEPFLNGDIGVSSSGANRARKKALQTNKKDVQQSKSSNTPKGKATPGNKVATSAKTTPTPVSVQPEKAVEVEKQPASVKATIRSAEQKTSARLEATAVSAPEKEQTPGISIVSVPETPKRVTHLSKLNQHRFNELMEKQTIPDYIAASNDLLKCDLPKEISDIYHELTTRLSVLEDASRKFETQHNADTANFCEYYIPESLRLTVTYLEYLDAQIGDKIISDTRNEVMDAMRKLILAVNEKIDDIYKFAAIETKAKAKALETLMSQDGYVDTAYKMNRRKS